VYSSGGCSSATTITAVQYAANGVYSSGGNQLVATT